MHCRHQDLWYFILLYILTLCLCFTVWLIQFILRLYSYQGADLSALCREAALAAISAHSQINHLYCNIDNVRLQCQVTMKNFTDAVLQVREIFRLYKLIMLMLHGHIICRLHKLIMLMLHGHIICRLHKHIMLLLHGHIICRLHKLIMLCFADT